MKVFIIDTNILFSGLLKDSVTRELLIDCPFVLYAPEEIINEIRKYEQTILERTGFTKEEFEILFALLTEKITIVSKENYFDFLGEADKLIGMVDKDDIPFLALALSMSNDGIWTDDEHFERQSKIRVWKTDEIIQRGI